VVKIKADRAPPSSRKPHFPRVRPPSAFSFAQTGLKGFAVIATVASQRISRAHPGHAVRRTVFEVLSPWTAGSVVGHRRSGEAADRAGRGDPGAVQHYPIGLLWQCAPSEWRERARMMTSTREPRLASSRSIRIRPILTVVNTALRTFR